ncbi:hypothetical protein [Natrinema sp. SYSU A 869]|uniref:hypothetical protein n=1 Tax=Natrinema sp. SYSU A 869 TaxID=2871694 RepID=UPI001CA402B9|nr:hypothetical protein [Natrinema sp. SYSU A 869]
MDYVDYSAWNGHGSDTDWAEAVDRFLERSQRQQHDRLTDELDRIAEQLAERDELHAEIVDELEWKIDRYTDQLEQLSRLGRDTGEGRRAQLKDTARLAGLDAGRAELFCTALVLADAGIVADVPAITEFGIGRVHSGVSGVSMGADFFEAIYSRG